MFEAAAVNLKLGTPFGQIYRPYGAGVSPDHLVVEHCAAAPLAAPGGRFCS